MEQAPAAPPANEYSSKDTKLIRKALESYKKNKSKSSKSKIKTKFGASVKKYLNQRGNADVTRATGSYTLKIAKLRFPKGYHNPIPERYDTIPIEYLKPSFIVPRYQQDLDNERWKKRKIMNEEENASAGDNGILNAKNVIW